MHAETGPLAYRMIADFERYISSPKWDKNAYRAGFGSDTLTRADGTVLKIKPGMVVSREDAVRDLNRRLKEFEATAARNIGREAWERLPPSAQAALISTTYNYGSLGKQRALVAAARAGNLQGIANALTAMGAHNKGENMHRRKREAAYVLGDLSSLSKSKEQGQLGNSAGYTGAGAGSSSYSSSAAASQQDAPQAPAPQTMQIPMAQPLMQVPMYGGTDAGTQTSPVMSSQGLFGGQNLFGVDQLSQPSSFDVLSGVPAQANNLQNIVGTILLPRE